MKQRNYDIGGIFVIYFHASENIKKELTKIKKRCMLRESLIEQEREFKKMSSENYLGQNETKQDETVRETPVSDAEDMTVSDAVWAQCIHRSEVRGWTDEEKISHILKLEAELNTERKEKLALSSIKRKSLRFAVIGGLVALSALLYKSFDEANDKIEQQEVEIETLETELRSAVLSDEANAKNVRSLFANRIAVVARQHPFVAPTDLVKMMIDRVKKEHKAGNVALIDAQIRVVGQDLLTLAATAEKTQTVRRNFLKAVEVYGKCKPNEYENADTPVVQTRARLDLMLMKAGREQKNKN